MYFTHSAEEVTERSGRGEEAGDERKGTIISVSFGLGIKAEVTNDAIMMFKGNSGFNRVIPHIEAEVGISGMNILTREATGTVGNEHIDEGVMISSSGGAGEASAEGIIANATSGNSGGMMLTLKKLTKEGPVLRRAPAFTKDFDKAIKGIINGSIKFREVTGYDIGRKRADEGLDLEGGFTRGIMRTEFKDLFHGESEGRKMKVVIIRDSSDVTRGGWFPISFGFLKRFKEISGEIIWMLKNSGEIAGVLAGKILKKIDLVKSKGKARMGCRDKEGGKFRSIAKVLLKKPGIKLRGDVGIDTVSDGMGVSFRRASREEGGVRDKGSGGELASHLTRGMKHSSGEGRVLVVIKGKELTKEGSEESGISLRVRELGD